MKHIFVTIFDFTSHIYNDDINLLMELKLEAHLNSLLAQLVELCSQLPGSSYSEVIDSLKAHGSAIDFSPFKQALANLESQSISRGESQIIE